MTTRRRTAHLDDAELGAARTGTASEGATRHLEVCAACRGDLAVAKELSAVVLETTCPDPLLLVARARGGPPAPALDEHLASCEDCAFDVERLVRMDAGEKPLPAPPRARSLPTPADAAGALLSALAALVSFEPPEPSMVRSRGAVAVPRLDSALEALRAGRHERALEDLEHARAAAPDVGEIAFYLGTCRLALNDAQGAERDLTEAARLAPELGEIRWYRAQALLRLGRAGEAARELDRAARLAGPYRERSRALAREVRRIAKAHADR